MQEESARVARIKPSGGTARTSSGPWGQDKPPRPLCTLSLEHDPMSMSPIALKGEGATSARGFTS
jgi:hypothetical protein